MDRALLISLPLLVTSVPAFANSQDFLNKAMMGDNLEATLGNMAAARASTAAVRRFGAMLAADHTKARREALPMVKK